jgi:hypothetical protein
VSSNPKSKNRMRFSISELLNTPLVKNNLKIQQMLNDIKEDKEKPEKKRKVNSQQYNKEVFLANCKYKYKKFEDINYITELENGDEDLYFYTNNPDGKLMRLIYRIPSKELNINRKLNWTVKHKYANLDKEYGYLKTKNILYKLNIENLNLSGFSLETEIEYCVRRNVDDDNLDGTFKHMRDGIYLALNIDDKAQISSKRTLKKIKSKNEYLILTLNKISH